MRQAFLALAVLALAVPAVAAQREVQPVMTGALGLLQRTGQTTVGVGAEAASSYGVRDWLSLEARLSGFYFRGIEEVSPSDRQFGAAYNAMRFTVLPMVRLAPPASLWPQLLGEHFVPSIALGVGYAAERQGGRVSTYRGLLLGSLDDRWEHQAVGAAAVGLDTRIGSTFALGLLFRYATPLGAQFGRSADVSAGLAASLFFYP